MASAMAFLLSFLLVSSLPSRLKLASSSLLLIRANCRFTLLLQWWPSSSFLGLCALMKPSGLFQSLTPSEFAGIRCMVAFPANDRECSRQFGCCFYSKNFGGPAFIHPNKLALPDSLFYFSFSFHLFLHGGHF